MDPVDTGRKLNVHNAFRRRPGRLLDVLCTFNLCPASAQESVVKHLASMSILSASFKISNIFTYYPNMKIS